MSVILVLSERAAQLVRDSVLEHGDEYFGDVNASLAEHYSFADVHQVAEVREALEREIDAQLMRPHSQGVIGDPEADVVELASGARSIIDG
jgi:hypothetical protein